MTDMENKDLPQEEQAEQPREPVEDGFSQPPAPESPEESEPVPPETAEPRLCSRKALCPLLYGRASRDTRRPTRLSLCRPRPHGRASPAI